MLGEGVAEEIKRNKSRLIPIFFSVTPTDHRKPLDQQHAHSDCKYLINPNKQTPEIGIIILEVESPLDWILTIISLSAFNLQNLTSHQNCPRTLDHIFSLFRLPGGMEWP